MKSKYQKMTCPNCGKKISMDKLTYHQNSKNCKK